jgi:hypothetical protein
VADGSAFQNYPALPIIPSYQIWYPLDPQEKTSSQIAALRLLFHLHPVKNNKVAESALRRGTATAEPTVCLMFVRIIQARRLRRQSRWLMTWSLATGRKDPLEFRQKSTQNIPSCSPCKNHKRKTPSITHQSLITNGHDSTVSSLWVIC